MFAGFDRSLLDSPAFKEDAVREVIITPMLTRLGFTPSGDNRVVRSTSLAHSFIYAGTRKLAITLIPDYTLFVKEKPLCILDAKSPAENILTKKNVEQVYSYAFHPEIKCPTFSLCNGKQLAVFDINESAPLLVVDFDDYESKWSEIERHLSPRYLKTPGLRKFAPDMGKAMARIGLSAETKIVMLGAQLNTFARVTDELMTASSNTTFAEEQHCVSFDFHPKLLPEMLAGLPSVLAGAFKEALGRSPFMAAAELAIELDLEMHLGEEVQGGAETFIPLVIDQVIAARFNPAPLAREAADMPDHIFRLRKSYKIAP